VTTDIVVPVLGESVTEATIAKWLKQPGDAVAVDEPIVELETEKATVELGAPNAGVLAEILAAEGEDVAVGAVIGRIKPSEGAAAPEPRRETAVRDAPRAPEVAKAAAPPASPPHTAAPAQARPDLDPTTVSRTAPGNRISAEDLRSFLGEPADDASRSGPAARKLLAEHGLEATAVPASGPGGRVTKGDVLAHIAAQPPATTARSAAPREERVKMTRLRRTIAARLVEAQATAAILTTFNEIDMSAVMAARSRHKDAFEKKHGVRLGFSSFFAKAVVAALREVPEVNAEIDGDEIVFKNYYHLGMAVSAPTGLVVPVIRDCDRKSFAEIEAALADLAERARDGKLSPDEMRGGTFTISNGGVFGSLLSTPILNRPQSGILGLHKIEDRPIAQGGEVVVRPMMYVALSYDHRLVDGREAVTFLVRVKQAIESPERLLLDV
jgi:2-oxoglutarate dehydrogenase E2 component (dihydrolipoamide succinyltransferase)